VLGDLISISGETRWLGHLEELKHVFEDFEKISTALDNNLYAAASLKPLFTSILSRRTLIEALICVYECIERPLVKLQVILS
jgi:hypothetical protein